MQFSIPVEPGSTVDLAAIDPEGDGGLDKKAARGHAAELVTRLGELQQELYASAVHSVLVVLQGLDTSGKDGTIRHVFAAVNPQGCEVTSFKQPNPVELAHDYLWRVHRRIPAKGMLGIFNRSHYEDVLVVRVHQLVPPEVWQPRYQQINQFEQMLAANGTVVCKFYLHISRDEQERRLHAREQEVEKAYKLSPADWTERARWDDYVRAYEDALGRCSTPEAPWHVVPANRKWYRNLAIAEALVERLDAYRPAWQAHLRTMSRERVTELKALRRRQHRH